MVRDDHNSQGDPVAATASRTETAEYSVSPEDALHYNQLEEMALNTLDDEYHLSDTSDFVDTKLENAGDTSEKSDDPNIVKEGRPKWTSILQRYQTNKFPVNTKTDESFATMLRKSKLMQMGELKNTNVIGEIFEVNGDDLYIDFGGKFHCVCQRPAVNSEEYVRGAQVKLLLKSFEMSRSFLGSGKHVTLLEADAILLSLIKEDDVKVDPRIVPSFDTEELVVTYGQTVETA